MVQRIELPDGSIAEFPDGMADADIEAVLAREMQGGGEDISPVTVPSLAEMNGESAPAAPGPSFGDQIAADATEVWRTLGGGIGDMIGNTGNFLYDAADTVLRNDLYNIPAAVGDEANYEAALADLKSGADIYRSVPQPQNPINRFIRPLTSVATGGGLVNAGLKAAQAGPTLVPQAVQAGRNALNAVTAGAVADAVVLNPEDGNLSNVVQDETGIELPTAKQEGDSVWVKRMKDVLEGGVLGRLAEAGIAVVGKALGKSADEVRNIKADDVDEQMVEELVIDPDVRGLLEANGVFNPQDPQYADLLTRAEERLRVRREAEAARQLPPEEISVEQNARELERRRLEQEGIADGEIDPGAASTAGRQEVPPRPIQVDTQGNAAISSEVDYRPDTVRENAAQIQAGERASIQRDFDLARREPEYQARRAEAERTARAAGQDPEYEALARRVGEDPGELVTRELGIPPEQYRALPNEARVRVAEAAQRQRAAQTPGEGVYRSSDAALSEGQAQYNPATRPTASVESPAWFRGDQPTAAELDAGDVRYSRAASGTSDRPFRAPDENLTPEQNARFEEDATFRAEEMRKQTVEDLERKWRERANAKDGERGRNFDAEQKYQGQKGGFTNTPKKPDAAGRYETDEFNFVRSSKGGPIRFGDQKQAARWIVNEGHKKSPDQIFEIENHPSGQGYTVREYGKGDTAPAPEGKSVVRTESGTEPTQGPKADSPEGGSSTRSRDSSPNTMTEDPAKSANQPSAGAEPRAARAAETEEAAGSVKQKTKAEIDKEAAESSTSLSSTFYSTPFDPKLMNELLGKPLAKALGKQKDEFVKSLDEFKTLFGKRNTATSKSVGQSVADVGRIFGYSNRAMLRVFEERYPGIKEIRELADMLATRPGDKRVVGETFNEVMDRRPLMQLQRVINMLDGKESNLKYMDGVGDVLSGRVTAKPGSELDKISKKIRGLLDEEHKYLTDAGLEVGYVKKNYFPRVVDYNAVMKDPTGFRDKAKDIYRKAGLSKAEAEEAADDWFNRVLGVGRSQYAQTTAGTSKFTKGRVLPRDADKIMKDFYITDPIENLSAYFRQTTQRAEFATRFGKNGEKVDEMFDNMLKQGVKPQDLSILRSVFDSVTGGMGQGTNNILKGATSWIQTIGTMTLLPRAVVSSLAESMATGVRSGSALDSLEAFFTSWQAAFGGKKDARAAAEAMGIVGQAQQQMILAQRFGGGMDSKLQQRLLTNFFNRTGLQGLTEGQRTASTMIGQKYVRQLLKEAGDSSRSKSAKELLGELGIKESDIPSLNKWLGEEDMIPLSKLTEDTADAGAYRNAIARFVDESIQNPKAVDRPIFANHPVGRMMYSIMSFQYAFTRNVLFRTAKQLGKAVDTKADYTIGDRARMMGTLLPFTMLMAGQMGVSRMREELYNPEGQKEKTEKEKVMLDLSRSGITGAMDPLVNAFASLKYERDLSNLAVGANLGFFLEKAAKLAALPTDKNNPNTNNAEWAATRAAYQMIVTPVSHVALSLLPGSSWMRAGYGALMAAPAPVGVSAPQTSRAVADAIVGERTIKRRGKTTTSKGKNPFEVEFTDDFGDDFKSDF